MNLTPFDHITYIIHLKFDTVMFKLYYTAFYLPTLPWYY